MGLVKPLLKALTVGGRAQRMTGPALFANNGIERQLGHCNLCRAGILCMMRINMGFHGLHYPPTTRGWSAWAPDFINVNEARGLSLFLINENNNRVEASGLLVGCLFCKMKCSSSSTN